MIVKNKKNNKIKTKKLKDKKSTIKKIKKKKKYSKKIKNYKKNINFKKYIGGFIEAPPKIPSHYSPTNPTVSSEDVGDPYQRANNQLQTNNKNHAALNKTLNGQSQKISGGKKKLMRKY